MDAEKKDLQFKLLLGDDRSDHALAALALLEDLPLPPGTDVTVFRAFSPTQSTDLVLMEDALNQTCNRLKKKGLIAHPELLLGVPTVKFLKQAEEQKPDLIIIGAKGLRATTGILVGGVAQQVVEYAPCPVLVVRAPYHGLREVMVVTDGSASASWSPALGDARASAAAHIHAISGDTHGQRAGRPPGFGAIRRAGRKGAEGWTGAAGWRSGRIAGSRQACHGHPEEGRCCHRDHGSDQATKY